MQIVYGKGYIQRTDHHAVFESGDIGFIPTSKREQTKSCNPKQQRQNVIARTKTSGITHEQKVVDRATEERKSKREQQVISKNKQLSTLEKQRPQVLLVHMLEIKRKQQIEEYQSLKLFIVP